LGLPRPFREGCDHPSCQLARPGGILRSLREPVVARPRSRTRSIDASLTPLARRTARRQYDVASGRPPAARSHRAAKSPNTRLSDPRRFCSEPTPSSAAARRKLPGWHECVPRPQERGLQGASAPRHTCIAHSASDDRNPCGIYWDLKLSPVTLTHELKSLAHS
jgi:hypothetical protein